MPQPEHQADGLIRLFQTDTQPPCILSLLAASRSEDSGLLALALAGALPSVCLVQTGHSRLSALLGCRILRSWQPGLDPDAQIITVQGYHLLHAPESQAGDAEVIAALSRCKRYSHIVFDGGEFSPVAAPLDPHTRQTLLVSVHQLNMESGYALLKGLRLANSEAEVLLIGTGAERLAQLYSSLLGVDGLDCKMTVSVCQNSNTNAETSSNTLTTSSNLSWIVSRIQAKNHKRVANGGIGKSTQQIGQG